MAKSKTTKPRAPKKKAPPPINLGSEGGIAARLLTHANIRECTPLDLMASTPATMALEPGDLAVTRVAMSDVFILARFNARRDCGDLKKLAASIKESGLDNALTVIKKTFGKRTVYGVLAGERRFRALHLIDAKHVAVRVFEGSAEQARELSHIENFQRLDLSHWEEAELCAKLRAEGMRLAQVAKRLGRSGSWVSNMVTIVERLDPDIYRIWKKYPGAVRIATAICRLPHAEQAKRWNAWIREHEKDKNGKRKKRPPSSKTTMTKAEQRNHIATLRSLLGATADTGTLMAPSAREYWAALLFGLELAQGATTFSQVPKKYASAYVAAEKKLKVAQKRAKAAAAARGAS